PFANRETLPLIREKELAKACRVLDIDYKLLGYRDKTMEYEDVNEVAKHIKGILEEIEPSLVITHYPNYAVHPDHNAIGAATIEAVRLMEPNERPKVWAQAISRSFKKYLGEPDITHDISGHFDKKVEEYFPINHKREELSKVLVVKHQKLSKPKPRLKNACAKNSSTFGILINQPSQSKINQHTWYR